MFARLTYLRSLFVYFIESTISEQPRKERNTVKLTATKRDFLPNPRDTPTAVLNKRTATAIAPSNWCSKRRGRDTRMLFSLIHFFESFCINYIPHNYVIPQDMPHAIPQTYSVFYPHRFPPLNDV